MSVKAKSIGLRLIRIVNSIVDFALLAIIVLMVIIGTYALWDANRLYSQADAKQYEIYKPTAKNQGQSFEQLRTINPEVIAWLIVYGTNIDYPVTQSDDNWKYVSTNAQGEYALAGNIFLDYNNSQDFSDFNSILYGHHMEKQTMFGEIELFSEKEFFDNHQYGNLYFDGKDHGLEFFAFLHVDAYDSSVFSADIKGEQQLRYLDNLLEKADFTRALDIGIDDNIVLLSTCSAVSTNGRDILVAKISDTTFQNTFTETESGETGVHPAIDKQLNTIWLGIPVLLWLIALIMIVIVIILLAVYYKKRKNRQNRQNVHE